MWNYTIYNKKDTFTTSIYGFLKQVAAIYSSVYE